MRLLPVPRIDDVVLPRLVLFFGEPLVYFLAVVTMRLASFIQDGMA